VVEYDDECDERDYCVPDDESATAKGDYVSHWPHCYNRGPMDD